VCFRALGSGVIRVNQRGEKGVSNLFCQGVEIEREKVCFGKEVLLLHSLASITTLIKSNPFPSRCLYQRLIAPFIHSEGELMFERGKDAFLHMYTYNT